MTNQEVYERGVKIHKQMEEYLKTHSVEVYTEGETKLYKKVQSILNQTIFGMEKGVIMTEPNLSDAL